MYCLNREGGSIGYESSLTLYFGFHDRMKHPDLRASSEREEYISCKYPGNGF